VYSEATAHLIDSEVERLLTEQQERGKHILGGHRHALEAVAAALIEQETISGETVADIVDGASWDASLGGRGLVRAR
jgi:cell division protease FtsH